MHPNQRFRAEAKDAVRHFPELRLIERNGKPLLTGVFRLIAADGEELDSYSVEVHPTATYPDSYPFVYETGGRLPRNIDWHMYPDGHCCLAPPIEEALDCWRGINLTVFIQTKVNGFFHSQTFHARNGYFYQERSHGFVGVLEYYKEALALQPRHVFPALRFMAKGPEPKSNSKCFCQSRRKYRKCHRRELRTMSRKASANVRNDYAHLESLIRRHLKQPA